MEQRIPISTINDFLYSPRSLYLHSIYQSFNTALYHSTYQTKGTLNHKAIDEGEYSSQKRYLQGLAVASEEFRLVGKIDIYDQETKTLIERKTKIKSIYQGHRYQLYAQMFCLEEMGYDVKYLKIHSLEDNKRYAISLPTQEDREEFQTLIRKMIMYNPLLDEDSEEQKHRCELSIYKELSY